MTPVIFRRFVVSIRQSKPLTKFEKMWNSPCIAIEDPFELSHNLGAGISRKSKKELFNPGVNFLPLSEPLHQESVHQWTAFVWNSLDLKSSRLSNSPGGPRNRNNAKTTFFSSQDYFFDRELLTDGDPPNDRGCRACGKVQINNSRPIFLNPRLFWSLLQIGHLVADCPRKKAADNRKRQEKDRRERQNQEAQRMEEQSSGKRRDRQSQDRVRRLFPDKRLS